MTTAEARARLERNVAHDMEPPLSSADITDLLAQARRPDPAGLLPSDPGWVPTWDLNAASRAAWEVKAGRAASGFRFSADGESFSPDQVHAHCLNMAKLYRRGAGSVRISTSFVEDLVSR